MSRSLENVEWESYWESRYKTQHATVHRLEDRIRELREALIRCAEIAGVDGEAVEAARSGAMTHPSIEDFSIEAVTQLRKDYDEDVMLMVEDDRR